MTTFSPIVGLLDQYVQIQAALPLALQFPPDLPCILSLEGAFHWVDSCWETGLGWSATELYTQNWLDLVHPDDRLTSQTWLTTLSSPQAKENRLRHKDGSYRWVAWHLMREGETITALARDITPWKQPQPDPQSLEALRKDFWENSPLFMFVKDREGRYVLCNDRADQVLPRQQNVRIGKTDHDLFPPDLAQVLRDHDQMVLEKGHSMEWEEIVAGVNGLENHLTLKFPISTEVGTPYAIGGIVVDITQVRQAALTLQEEKAALEAQVAERTAALRESEARFHQLAESIEEIFWVLTPQGELLYASPAYEVIWGQSMASIQADPCAWLNAIHPDDLDRVVQQFLTISSAFELEYRIIHPDGSVRWVWDRGFPIFDDRGILTQTVGITTDITDRKQAEEDLQDREEQLRTMVEVSPIGISWLDLKTLYYAKCNPAYCRMMGYTEAEITQRSLADLSHPDDLNADLANVQLLLKGSAQHFHMEKRFLRKDGSLLWATLTCVFIYDQDGNPRYSLGFNEDITDRKLAEVALRESETRFRTIFELSPVGIGLVELDTYQYVRANPALCKMLGYTEAELLKLNLASLSPPEDVERDLHQMEQLLRGEISQFSLEKRYFRKDGQQIWIKLTVTLFNDHNGKPRYSLGLKEDITDRKRAEAEIHTLNAKLEQRVQERTAELYRTNQDLMREIIAREQAEIELQENQRFTQQIIDTIPEILYLFSLKEQRNIFSNHQITELPDYSPEAVKAMGETFLTKVVHPDDLDKVKVHLTGYASIQDGELRQIEYRVRHADGSWHWLHCREILFSRTPEGEPLLILGTAQDITDRKLIELERQQVNAALRVSEQRFRALIENATDVIVILDHDGIFRYASPSSQKILGYLPDQVVNQSAFDFVHPEDGPLILQTLTQAVQNPGISQPAVVYRVRHTDGSWRMFEAVTTNLLNNQAVEGVVVNCRDITDRQQAESALRDSEERFRQVAENIDSVFWIWSVDEQRSLYVSPAYERVWGRTLESFYETPGAWLASIYPDDQPACLEVIDRQKQGEPVEVSYRILRPTGEVRWVYDRSFPILDANNRCYRIAGIVEDITDRKQAEARLMSSLQEKEVLLREIHHRVKNNLQIICSLLDLQANRTQDDRAHIALQDSQNRVKSMALVHETLYRSQNFAQINFAQYIRNLIASLFHTYSLPSHNLTFDLQVTTAVEVNLDQAIPCGLILNELLTNALKYGVSKDGSGHIAIDLNKDDANQHLTISVSNTGDYLPPHFQLHQISSLGLRLVMTLVDQLGGTLSLERGNRTIFRVEFPITST